LRSSQGGVCKAGKKRGNFIKLKKTEGKENSEEGVTAKLKRRQRVIEAF